MLTGEREDGTFQRQGKGENKTAEESMRRSLARQTIKMKFSLVSILSLASAALAAPATVMSVSYDETYDNAATSLANLACSDGEHGLMPKGYKIIGDLPKFPYVAGISAVAGWNSPFCGTCWKITYKGHSVNVLAVDVGSQGVNMALDAMNDLTKNQAKALGRIQANAEQVAAHHCGL
ncbi:hypothetical protein KEM56_001063 [Ascosphaera pollenicola]|nr:hypothetical protein KEM56_001063 [Ascosphaera pollenicola]